ncbi:thioredoxin family protein [Candidatus Dependentiae bacterium]|nr:thioredoxin family protein [Candidatus Dependentiae bacterium]
MAFAITEENFKKEVLESTLPVVMKVYAVWCGPCQHMVPVFEAVAKANQGKAKFVELNVDQARELAIQFGITSVPTTIFIKNGTVVGKELGYIGQQELQERIDRFFA